jgi:hypothetical protein
MKSKNKWFRNIIFILLLVGLYGSGILVFEELKTGNGCPKLYKIPMCIVIFICFLIPFISHLLNKWKALYYIFTGIAGSIALLATIMQFFGHAECPKTSSGTPMCYYSLILFSSLIIFKILDQKQLIKS